MGRTHLRPSYNVIPVVDGFARYIDAVGWSFKSLYRFIVDTPVKFQITYIVNSSQELNISGIESGIYHQTFSIMRTKSQHFKVSRLVLQLSLPNQGFKTCGDVCIWYWRILYYPDMPTMEILTDWIILLRLTSNQLSGFHNSLCPFILYLVCLLFKLLCGNVF